MSEHPLSRQDLPLIQDLFLTKIVMLQSGRALTEEWRFELGVLEALSAGTWASRNAFLFDYTLARVAAAEAVDTNSAARRRAEVDANPAARAFVDAVAAGNCETAQSLWTSIVAETDGPWSGGLTASLIRSLSDARDAGVSPPDLQLPPEFSPTPETPNSASI